MLDVILRPILSILSIKHNTKIQSSPPDELKPFIVPLPGLVLSKQIIPINLQSFPEPPKLRHCLPFEASKFKDTIISWIWEKFSFSVNTLTVDVLDI